ncbi:hypothetical protein D9611_007019 [Ephemerocybe angulata]|uniref:NADP-dependent oxidoreductase domain-containing protein n=1 Tax=Ephemerocybe angulata TaxID=980116 RepID=A0A8H5EWG8_9AGAR|nr:hypothetical protein D9611_007019 [Tulosesus angulatus]
MHLNEAMFAPLRPSNRKWASTYRKLAGVHISPICLGVMSIGDKCHEYGMGLMPKKESFNLVDVYYDLGGNIIDTANFYVQSA